MQKDDIQFGVMRWKDTLWSRMGSDRSEEAEFTRLTVFPLGLCVYFVSHRGLYAIIITRDLIRTWLSCRHRAFFQTVSLDTRITAIAILKVLQ